MFEYGQGFFEQNDIALDEMRGSMSFAAVSLAELMAEQDLPELEEQPGQE